MSWGLNKIRARNILAVALLITASGAAANILVIRSIGPSAKTYPPGKRLPASGKIILKPSDQLVLLDGRGTRTLKGPGSFALNAAPQRANGTGAGSPLRRRIAATRDPERPTYWDINISRGGAICVADRNSVRLWREDFSRAMTMTISRTKDKRPRRLDWAPGDGMLKWPSQMPITENAAFELNWKGAAAPTLLRFKILSKKAFALEDAASVFIANGCTAQLNLLIEQEQKKEAGAPTD